MIHQLVQLLCNNGSVWFAWITSATESEIQTLATAFASPTGLVTTPGLSSLYLKKNVQTKLMWPKLMHSFASQFSVSPDTSTRCIGAQLSEGFSKGMANLQLNCHINHNTWLHHSISSHPCKSLHNWILSKWYSNSYNHWPTWSDSKTTLVGDPVVWWPLQVPTASECMES